MKCLKTLKAEHDSVWDEFLLRLQYLDTHESLHQMIFALSPGVLYQLFDDTVIAGNETFDDYKRIVDLCYGLSKGSEHLCIDCVNNDIVTCYDRQSQPERYLNIDDIKELIRLRLAERSLSCRIDSELQQRLAISREISELVKPFLVSE